MKNLISKACSIIITVLAIMVMLTLTICADSDSKSDRIKLEAPTNLSWGRLYDTRSDNFEYHDMPGVMSWKCNNNDAIDYYDVKLYDASNNKEIFHLKKYQMFTINDTYYYSDTSIVEGMYQDANTYEYKDLMLESGTYYFTVQAVASDYNYTNSDIVKSPEWTYVKPEKSISFPADLWWNGRTANWTERDNESLTYIYHMEFYKFNDNTGEYDLIYKSRNVWRSCERLYANFLKEYGIGKYYFRVRTTSRDITKEYHSSWSEYSPVFFYDGTVSTVEMQLEDFIYDINDEFMENELSDDDKLYLRNRLRRIIDSSELQKAMLEDSDIEGNGTGVISKIKKIQQRLGDVTQVNIKNADELGISDKDVTVIGANFNNDDGDAVLNIGQVNGNIEVPSEYKNALKFSMTLGNVENSSELDIPVKITMPIPENINGDYISILHFKNDNNYEVIEKPYVFIKDGKQYVSFVVTGFSDFAMVEHENNYEIGYIDLSQKNVKILTGNEAGTLVACVYDTNGKMITSKATEAGDSSSFNLECNEIKRGYVVKLFFMNDKYVPVHEAKEQVV